MSVTLEIAEPVTIDGRFILATVATSLGFLLVQLDVTIVNVALATMGSELHSAISELQWVVDAYAIAFASLLLSAGALADRMGSRRVLASGFAIFIAGSAACGFAPSSTLLVAARVAQGVGAALMVPSSLSLLNYACGSDQKLRGHAVAWWTAAGSVGLAAGPVAGGFLISWFGWRSIFFVNVPLGLLAIWLTLSFFSETKISSGRKGFDIIGQLLGIVTLAALTGAFIEAGERGALNSLVLGCFALAIIGGAGFIFAETRSANPILPLGLFRNLRFSSTILVGLVINFTLYVLIGVGPDADRRAKPLIYQTIEGSILDAYLQRRSWQCLDCEGPDPLKSPHVAGWFFSGIAPRRAPRALTRARNGVPVSPCRAAVAKPPYRGSLASASPSHDHGVVCNHVRASPFHPRLRRGRDEYNEEH
jgi:MFS family permease